MKVWMPFGMPLIVTAPVLSATIDLFCSFHVTVAPASGVFSSPPFIIAIKEFCVYAVTLMQHRIIPVKMCFKVFIL